MRTALLLTLLLAAAMMQTANAETLAADSLVCEDPESLELVRPLSLTGKSGTESMSIAAKHVEYGQLALKVNAVYQRQAIREEEIRARYGTRGSNTARLASLQEEARATNQELQSAERFLKRCAASAEAQTAEILERRAITGVARVRITFRGSPAEVWVLTDRLHP